MACLKAVQGHAGHQFLLFLNHFSYSGMILADVRRLFLQRLPNDYLQKCDIFYR